MPMLNFFSLTLSLALLLITISNGEFIRSSDGTLIFASALGNPHNPPIVFVHGITLSALVFDDLFRDPRLLDHFYLVSYDLRGHGRSGKPNTTAGYASNLFADDFAAVTKTFDVKSPLFVGWSYGGTVLSDIFAHLPLGTISGIVAVAAIPFLGLPVINTPHVLSLIPGFSVTDNVSVDIATKVEFIDSCFNDPEKVPTGVIWSWIGSAVIQLPPITVLATTRVQDPTNFFAAGEKGLIRYLSIIGTNDQILLNENITAEISPHFPNLEVHRVKGGSHAVFFDNEDEFVRVLVPFANEILRKSK